MSDKSLHVTKTYLPPLSQYEKYLKNIWKSGWITNNGQMVKHLEKELKNYLGVKNNLFLVANGTMGLQIGIKKLEKTFVENKKDYILCKYEEGKIPIMGRMFYRIEYLKKLLSGIKILLPIQMRYEKW